MKYMSMDIVGMLDTYLHSDGSWVCVRVAKTKELQHPPHYLSGLSRSSRTSPVGRHRMQKIIAELTCHVERWHRTCRGSRFSMPIAIRPCCYHLSWENFSSIGFLLKEKPPTVSLRNVLLASTICCEPWMIASRNWVVEDFLWASRCRCSRFDFTKAALAVCH